MERTVKMANEKRLIDANALMDSFRAYMADRYDREKCVSEVNCKTCESSCLWRKIVAVAPTVDAVEVVHGRWRFRKNWDLFVCSECSHESSNYSNYCPNCGAKMDGDGNVV